MAHRTKTDIIRARESEMGIAAFEIMLVIRHGCLSPFVRADLLQVHFELCYYGAIRDNRIEDICRPLVQRQIAQQPGPWPEGYFERKSSEAAL